jgi:hypothetical protein
MMDKCEYYHLPEAMRGVLLILGYSGGVRMTNDEKQLLQIQQDITVIQARIKVLKSGGINENDRIEGLTDVIGELKAKAKFYQRRIEEADAHDP